MALNSSRVWLDRELTDFAASLPDQALVLDAGAGSQTYAGKFSRQRYESADFEQVDKQYASSTYVCDLGSIPVEDNRYDAIVFTQVMEHLPEPQRVLAELHRILKPGGKVFFSAPLYYEEHEKPFDYYRYTQFALGYMFDKAGFDVDAMRWLEGFLGTASHMMRYLGKRLPAKPSSYGGGVQGLFSAVVFQIIALQLRLVASLAGRADIRHRFVEKGMPINYMAILIRR